MLKRVKMSFFGVNLYRSTTSEYDSHRELEKEIFQTRLKCKIMKLNTMKNKSLNHRHLICRRRY
ncbi:hypothetical protein MTR67_037382 [Solanum verrucosum]|uniref:Uncharacterized protein n=1 Tax=Solanum verrucosum TaxID=315347 RepID=A0AAF0ZLX8_SOLVR|nr:hypothetical protein MTR67_037382 [Solanum verrucosum]